MKVEKHISIRADEITVEKIRHIAEYQDRSVSRRIYLLINSYIRRFEEKHGEIILEEDRK